MPWPGEACAAPGQAPSAGGRPGSPVRPGGCSVTADGAARPEAGRALAPCAAAGSRPVAAASAAARTPAHIPDVRITRTASLRPVAGLALPSTPALAVSLADPAGSRHAFRTHCYTGVA